MANIENEQKVSTETPEKPKNFIDKFIDVISGIFIPILSVLIATGMIKGFTALLIALSVIDANSGTNQILQIIGDCFSKIQYERIYRCGSRSSFSISIISDNNAR